MIWAVTFICFFSLLSAGLALRSLILAGHLRRQEALRRRLTEVGPLEYAAQTAALKLIRDSSLSSIPLLDRILGRLPRTKDIQLLLHQAGNPCNLGALALISGTLALLGILAGSLRESGLLAIFLAGAGALAPVFWLRFLRKRRLAAFEEQFPEAVDMIARALRAGHGLGSALQMISEEMEDPLAEEFGRTFADYSYGKSLDQALGGLIRRVNLQDLKFFATAVVMQRETGGNLTEVLDNISHIIRDRFRLKRQIKALSAEGRLSGYILSLMPPVLLVILWFVSPSYLSIMFSHPLGKTLLLTGVGFQVAGMLVIKRLITLKV
jgi:tight adherence protein B